MRSEVHLLSTTLTALALICAGTDSTSGAEVEWTKHTVAGDFDAAESVHAGDVDGDGDVDILGAARFADDVTWWENTAGDGTAWIEHTIDGDFEGAGSVHAADLDADGDLDVLGAAQYADEIAWWENANGDGSVWDKHTLNGEFDGAAAVYAADVDGDSDLDVLAVAYRSDEVLWWENTHGDGSTWIEHVIDLDFLGAWSVYAEDLDDDGDVDVLGAAIHIDQVAWWENVNGDGTVWQERVIGGGFDEAASVFAVDMDGDGDQDVVGGAARGKEVSWWKNVNGDGSVWAKRAIDENFDVRAVHAADVDGDGDVDVLGVAADHDDDASWWENTHGDGSTWTEHAIDEDFDGAWSIWVADVDGDSDIDVLGAAYDADDIVWWESRRGCRASLTVRPQRSGRLLARVSLRHQISTTVVTEIRYRLRNEVGAIVTEWTDGPITFEPGDEYRLEGTIPWSGQLAPGSYRLELSFQGMAGVVRVTEKFEVGQASPPSY